MERSLLGLIYTEEVYNLEKTNAKASLMVIVDKSYNDQKELLLNILGSIGHTENSVSIIESEKKISPGEFEFNSLITFGVELEGFDREPYTALKEDDHVIIFAESLNEIEADSTKEKKKKLWKVLKEYLS